MTTAVLSDEPYQKLRMSVSYTLLH